MTQTHLETSSVEHDSFWKSKLFSFASSMQMELDQLLHVEQVDSLETMRTINTFYDYPSAILYDHNHRNE